MDFTSRSLALEGIQSLARQFPRLGAAGVARIAAVDPTYAGGD